MDAKMPLTWEDLLLLVRQLPEEDQEKLAYQVLKERGKSELNQLLEEIGEEVNLKDLGSLDGILNFVDEIRKGTSGKQNTENSSSGK